MEEISILNIIDLICKYDYALVMADQLERADKKQSLKFIAASDELKSFFEYIDDTLRLNKVQGFEYEEAILNLCDGNADKAISHFQDMYIKFRGSDYCRYTETFKQLTNRT
ncbi:MAG: hypothetical protein COA42_18775, partial [Alteromonadaceae bacterium]